MSAHDLIYGTVTLPDGRQCNAKLYGVNHPAPDGFDMRENDPLEIEWVDGTELNDDDYHAMVGENTFLHEFVTDELLASGKFEAWEPDYG